MRDDLKREGGPCALEEILLCMGWRVQWADLEGVELKSSNLGVEIHLRAGGFTVIRAAGSLLVEAIR